ncbi:MAG: phage virion morphogenesis protein [Desulfobacterales bacterium]|jgi:phage virion morphogenesis protein|nr:phage virion morphogenesis protein [Desulfobacterales bacterium]
MAGVTISISASDDGVLKLLKAAADRLADTRPLMSVIAETLKASVEKNFAAGGRPDRWPVSKRAGRDGGQTLSLTGRLRRSITAESGADWAAVGTNVKYAAIHQLGGKTEPRVIRPRVKKALKTPFGIFKSVRHPGSVMPERPFLMVQNEDWDEIRATIFDFLGL